MDLSVIVVNWNTEDLLRDCLASVMAGLGSLVAEIHVVDNSSSDGSLAMLKRDFPQVEVTACFSNLGFAKANNLALAHARGRYILLLNTDTLVHGDVLTAGIEFLDARPEVAVLGPRILNADGSLQISALRFPTLPRLLGQTFGTNRIALLDQYRMSGWDRSTAREVEVVSGCAMFVRKSAMEDVGVLDERFFFYGEETDWCRRFRGTGWKVMFAPVGDITHFGGASVQKLDYRRDVMLTSGTVLLHLKHNGYPGAIACFLILLIFNLSRAGYWSVLRVLNVSGARKRAEHFLRVCRAIQHAWPERSRG